MNYLLLLILPAIIAACEEWPISRVKTMHICSNDLLMFEVESNAGKTLHIAKDPDIKEYACYAKKESKMLKVINVPALSSSEAREICDYYKRRIIVEKKITL